MAEEHKEFIARFYELMKVTKQPVITDYDKAGMILFDEQSTEIRKLFAVDTVFNHLLDTSVAIFDLDGRKISLFLWPEQGNPITVFIHPIAGVANGESMTCAVSNEKIDVTILKTWLHQYFTNRAFKEEKISDKEHYVFVPKN